MHSLLYSGEIHFRGFTFRRFTFRPYRYKLTIFIILYNIYREKCAVCAQHLMEYNGVHKIYGMLKVTCIYVTINLYCNMNIFSLHILDTSICLLCRHSG